MTAYCCSGSADELKPEVLEELKAILPKALPAASFNIEDLKSSDGLTPGFGKSFFSESTYCVLQQVLESQPFLFRGESL